MRSAPRIEQYHRRRQRLARRRRSGARRRRPSLPDAPPAPAPCRLHVGADGDLRDALRELTRRALAYRAVTGLWYLCQGERVAVRVVAERPMTGLLRLLSGAWCAELDDAHPGAVWFLEISDRPPSPGQHYQCLYGYPH